MKLQQFSFVIPVFNRPQEVENLLLSISKLEHTDPFEVVIVEDGSSETCKDVCLRFRESINITYLYKENSGPGDSRNYGMSRANGDYFIILDSDCVLPAHYLTEVRSYLNNSYVDCYGGPDAAHERFSNLQKAINYSMTSFLTTGGIRGGSERLGKFQPRSFNMGISKKAFLATGGFSKIHPGEDPDLSIRLWRLGFETALISNAFVYHERRISWRLFFKQVNKFGKVRVILNKWYPDTRKFSYWFPFLFLVFLGLGVLFLFLGEPLLISLFVCYFIAVSIDSVLKNGLIVGVMSILAVAIQFAGYGMGFIHSWIQLVVLRKEEQKAFPYLFFS